MPFLPNPLPILALKLIGYSAAGFILQKIYKSRFNFLLFGVTRVVCGIVLGIVILPIAFYLSDNELLFLLLVRIPLWTLLIWLIYERRNFSLPRFIIVVLSGIALSFALDWVLKSLEAEFPDMMKIPFC